MRLRTTGEELLQSELAKLKAASARCDAMMFWLVVGAFFAGVVCGHCGLSGL